MNERIKLLAEQSYEAATITTIDPFTQEVVVDYIDGTKLIFNKEKFAELLEKEFEAKYFSAGYIAGRSDGTIETVKECAEQIIAKGTDWVDFAPSQTGVRPEYWDMAQQIKKHFGVEE